MSSKPLSQAALNKLPIKGEQSTSSPPGTAPEQPLCLSLGAQQSSTAPGTELCDHHSPKHSQGTSGLWPGPGPASAPSAVTKQLGGKLCLLLNSCLNQGGFSIWSGFHKQNPRGVLVLFAD